MKYKLETDCTIKLPDESQHEAADLMFTPSDHHVVSHHPLVNNTDMSVVQIKVVNFDSEKLMDIYVNRKQLIRIAKSLEALML